MSMNLYGRANFSMSTGKKADLRRWSLRLNVAALVILFVGYFLTTGTAVIESEGAKGAFRFVALLLILANIILGRAIKVQYMVALLFLQVVFALNQSQMVVNMMFLLLISASLYRLNGKEVAVVFLVAASTVLLLHIVLLNTGQLLDQSTEVEGRSRSTLGFTNANQASAIYLSFVILAIFAYHQFRTKASLFLVIMSFIATIFVFQITDTRTAMFALLILLLFQILDFLLHRLRTYRISFLFFAVGSPFFASAITFYLTTSTDPAMNILLSLRPYFFAEFMRDVTTTDFILGWSAFNNSGVDNLYLMMLSAVGAFGYFLIILIISYRIFRMNPKFMPIAIVLMAVSIFESFLIRPEIPVSALFLHLLFSRHLQIPVQARIQKTRSRWIKL